MDEELRYEIVEGDLRQKLNPGIDRSFAERGIAGALIGFHAATGSKSRPGGWWIGVETSVVYPGRPNGFIHDLVGWRRDRHEEGPKGKATTLRPDWVCEVMSTNRSNDVVTKRRVLHEHCVEHYWLVDVERRFVSVLQWSEKGYVTIQEAVAGARARLAPFQSVELEISVLLGDDPTD